MRDVPFNVLGDRYASDAMLEVWSPKRRIILERQLWVAVMKAQRELGVDISTDSIEAYEAAIEVIDFDRINTLELKLRHDVKARIEAFGEAAGGRQDAHKALTSRDMTDNVEQLQIMTGLKLVQQRTVAHLGMFGACMIEYAELDICGRTHHIPAQTTTMGKRFGMWADEMLRGYNRLEHCISTYPLRGIKGPVGTSQDMLDLLGSAEKVEEFERIVQQHLGFGAVFNAVGQVYPRSLDFEVVCGLAQLASAPGNMAKTLRLMAGSELAHEGFGSEQVGSTAMPHKVNSRSCERVNGLVIVLGGYVDMAQGLLGDQWQEGDVSCSVVRRVLFPDAFFALDGLYETAMTVLRELEVFQPIVSLELRRYLPFLSTTRLMVAAIRKGLGREQAHKIIREHAIAAVVAMHKGQPHDFVARLADDDFFPMGREAIEELVSKPNHGLAVEQVKRVQENIARLAILYPDAMLYAPGTIR